MANIGIAPSAKEFGVIPEGGTSSTQQFVISNTTSPVESVGIDSIAIGATAPFLAKFADEPDSAYRKSIESFVLSSGTTGLIDSPAVQFDSDRVLTEKTLCTLSATIAVDMSQIVTISPARTLRVSVFEYHSDTHTVTILKTIDVCSVSNTINQAIINRASATNFILAIQYLDLVSMTNKREIYLVKYDNTPGTEVLKTFQENAAEFQDYGCCSSFTGSTIILKESVLGGVTSYLCHPTSGISRVTNITKGSPVVPGTGGDTVAHINPVASGVLLYSFYGTDVVKVRGSIINIDEATGALTWTDNYAQVVHTVIDPASVEVSSQAISDDRAVIFFADSDGGGTYSEYAVSLEFTDAGITSIGTKQAVIAGSLNRPGVKTNTRERSSRSYAGYISGGMVLNMSVIDVLADGTVSVAETLSKPFAVPAAGLSIELLQSVILFWSYRAAAPPNNGYVYAQRLDSVGDMSKTLDVVTCPLTVGVFKSTVTITSRVGAVIETDPISFSSCRMPRYDSGAMLSEVMFKDL